MSLSDRTGLNVFSNISFYRFVEVDDPDRLADRVRTQCEQLSLLGKVVVANEGINGMLAGAGSDVERFGEWIHDDPRFREMRLKPSPGDHSPYKKLVVKVKPEIVTMGTPQVDAVGKTGRKLPAETFRDWLRSGRDLKVIDVRNDYEIRVGKFRDAVDPCTEYFHQFPEWVERHRDELEGDTDVVMYCTGGIRCEKATAWMLEQGIENVWQLEGGIHTYFERIDDAEEDWDGELFVFDQRVAVDTRLIETDTELCSECGDPVVHGKCACT